MLKHGNTPVTEVILHTSATPGSWVKGKTVDQMAAEIDLWHRSRGWRGIGYHRVVAPDGTIAEGRSIYRQGAHVKGHNTGTIGICLIPSFTVDGARIGEFGDYYTEEQREAVRAYIMELRTLADIKRVSGHNDYTNAKTCPGFKVVSAEWLAPPKPKPAEAPRGNPLAAFFTFFAKLFGAKQ